MRHGKKIHKLNRPAEHRKALMNNLAMALITYKQIQTTDARAKALKPFIDRLISTAQQNTLHAKRLVARAVKNKVVFKELFENVVPKLEGRSSGFTRIVKFKQRRGDGAPVSIIELMVEREVEEKAKKKAKKTASRKTSTAAKSAAGAVAAPAVDETVAEPIAETQVETAEAEVEETVDQVETESTQDSTEEASAETDASDEDEKKE